jgi:5-(carboxyamino)imidazole ribonucleotide mutase
VLIGFKSNDTNEQSSRNNGKYLRYARDAGSHRNQFDIEIEVDIVSAHRTPEKLFDFSKTHTRWISVILPVLEEQLTSWYGSINVTTSCDWSSCKSSNSIDGWDSILSILQMPGVPVATVALNGKNAGS